MTIDERLKNDLVNAMKSRDQLRVKTIRSLIAVIDNAGAIRVDSKGYDLKLGLGHDVTRRAVPADEIQNRFRGERDELLGAASEFRDLGQDERAFDLEKRADIVMEYIE